VINVCVSAAEGGGASESRLIVNVK
jgi:hypothetical protein